MSVPLIHQKKQQNEKFESENLKDFWEVKDMYTFENIGFSNAVDNKQYLICADCELGPIGYYDSTTKISYIALSRVLHTD